MPSTCNLPNDVQLLIGNDYDKTMTIENGVNNNIVGAVTRSQTAKEVKLVQETCVDKVVGADIPDQGVPGTSDGAHTNNILDGESLAESLHNTYDENVKVIDKTEAVDFIKLGELQSKTQALRICLQICRIHDHITSMIMVCYVDALLIIKHRTLLIKLLYHMYSAVKYCYCLIQYQSAVIWVEPKHKSGFYGISFGQV